MNWQLLIACQYVRNLLQGVGNVKHIRKEHIGFLCCMQKNSCSANKYGNIWAKERYCCGKAIDSDHVVI